MGQRRAKKLVFRRLELKEEEFLLRVLWVRFFGGTTFSGEISEWL